MDLITIGVLVVVGIFIGWHFPQPPWVKKAVDDTLEKF